MRKYSFLQGSSYDIRDLLLFIKKTFRWPIYLHQSASSTGMEYHHTYVDWASYEFVYSTYKDIVFDGDVEIDESLFGRKAKYNRGNPTGTRIWIFGMVQRSSNKRIMYPVDKRDPQKLIPLIEKQVALEAIYFQTVGLPIYTSMN
jgi:hypothetical protein